MKIFNLPDLGEGLPDAEIREWHVKVGDEVKTDQLMVSMETAKAVVDVPAPREGKISKLYGNVGDVILTGAPLVEFEDAGVTAPEIAQDKGTVVGKMEVGDSVLNEAAMGVTPQKNNSSLRVMPAVRSLAKKLNIDLSSVKGTGPEGQITFADVESAASQDSTKSTLVEAVPIRGLRKAMAHAMTLAQAEVALTTIMRRHNSQAWTGRDDFTVRVIHAIIAACKAEPRLNAWYDGQAVALKLCEEINLGIAIDTSEGLIVPVLKDVAHKSKEAWREEINRLKKQAADRSLPQEVLHGATFSMSNVGVFAGKYATPLVVPPMVGIVAMGKSRNNLLPLSLSFDHRAVTGGEASRFLAAMMQDLALAAW